MTHRSQSAADVTRRRFLAQLAAGVGVASGVSAFHARDAHALGADALDAWTGSSDRFQQRPRPNAAQLAWQQDELAIFVHFGVNTFTDREWGDGKESPSIFNPESLDARQWARAARSAGARAMILTAKHHDGFCLWPTATTTHSVASSPWKGGRGDVVQEFVDACRAEGLKPGLYCSPWDRNHPAYGDSDRYNDIYIAQLTELLTRYGAIQEVWFDGANGEGPNGKRQVYDWPRTWALVRKLQPNAVIFSDAGPDVRWIGNERGVAGETHWSTIRPESVPFIGASGDDVILSLQQGHADGSVWRPGETDVSIRPGWFHHPAEDAKVKTVEQLTGLYFTSVGRNSKLLLNVPPTRSGRFHDVDVARLAGMRGALDALFRTPVPLRSPSWRITGARSATASVALRTAQSITILDLREDIVKGQRVSAWTLFGRNGPLSGSPFEIARGTTIGHRQLRKVIPVTVTSLELRVETIEEPLPVTVRAYG